MLRQPHGRSVHAALLLTLTGLAACEAAPPTDPLVESLAVPAFAKGGNGAYVEKGVFDPFPAPPVPVITPCVDPDPMVTGTWSGWYQYAERTDGSYHFTEHIDWSDVTLVAADGRTWKPGPGAHESFSFNVPAPDDDNPEVVMHNLRARFNSQDGAPDLQVWHTIHVVIGSDGEPKVFRIVLPFEAKCLGNSR